MSNSFNKQNEETAVGSSSLTFDANGNLTLDDQGHTLVYDAWNRLVTVKNGATTLTSYKYDALGRRIVESPSGTAHDLYYDAAWQILEERWAGVSTATIHYIWSPVYIDALILRDRSTANNGTLDERLWVQQDANWNVTALINGSGTVVERYVYDPYGLRTVLDASFNVRSSSSYAFVHGFQGLRLDTTANEYDARGRPLSSTMGRPIRSDPLSFGAGDTNLYRFEHNAPPVRLDPSGLQDNGPISIPDPDDLPGLGLPFATPWPKPKPKPAKPQSVPEQPSIGPWNPTPDELYILAGEDAEERAWRRWEVAGRKNGTSWWYSRWVWVTRPGGEGEKIWEAWLAGAAMAGGGNALEKPGNRSEPCEPIVKYRPSVPTGKPQSVPGRRVQEAGRLLSEWLGPEAVIQKSDASGVVIMSKNGLRRFRIDWTGRGSPHSHLETGPNTNTDNWNDATDQHWIPIKPDE